ncbi:MAG: hypothetical protein Fur0025_47960 [Oscillatoriaceae cyanobacterium]
MLDINELFRETDYLHLYPDVAAAVNRGDFASGWQHFELFGAGESRNPCALFNQIYYLDNYPDVAAAVGRGEFGSALDHYLLFGQVEGRDTCAMFDEALYRGANPDVAAAIDPLTGGLSSGLEHYINFGQMEGRDPCARTVVMWDEVAQEAVRRTSPGPTIASRVYGMVHTAMFDAWSAYDEKAIGTQLEDELQRPAAENTSLNKSEAISYAAYRVLTDLFPSQVDMFDKLMAQLGCDSGNNSTDTATPAGIGNAAAAALLAFRHLDGSNQLNGYADTTGYQPVNGSDVVNDPDHWQPLRQPLDDPNGEVQRFLTPQWGEVTPFALTSPDQFRPPAPPEFGTPLYEQRAAEVLDLSANLTDEQKIIAEFWEDGAGTSYPPGTWMSFGQFLSQRDGHSLDEDVQMFFALGNAVMDAGIAAWEAKRYYDYVRPVTAIRYLYEGENVLAWGGPGEGTQLIDGGDWQPYQAVNTPTPPFAEYVSGHSTFSAASAEILRRFSGSDEFGESYTAAAGSSRFEPGVTPTTDITLFWPTFSAAADEAGMSRRYGGIHFQDGDLEGRTLGRLVGDAVWNRAQSYINGG